MKGHIGAFALLSGIVSGAAAVDVRDVQYADQDPATWCVTYLSTYLAPVSIATDLPRPAANTTDVGLISTSTAQDPDLTSSAASGASTSAMLEPIGQRIILLVSPSGGNTKRDLGGFVGDGNPDICTFAAVFTLGNGRLFESGVPVSYLGNGYQKLQASSSSSDNAISTTFSSEGGLLRFQNPSLPNGGASFCQTPADGQVYMTFASKPSGCVPVSLNVYRAEQCIDGRLNGLGPTTTSAKTDKTISTLSTDEASAETSGIESLIASTFSTEESGVPIRSPSPSGSAFSQETEAPSGSLTEGPTATQSQGNIVVTNAVFNGRFAIKDPNSESGILGFDAEGEAKQRNGNCYKADGSSDNGCVALGSSSDSKKRAFGGLASISQFLTNLAPSRTVPYTVQFYYVVITAGGSQACSVNAYLGNRQFYTMGLFTSGGLGVSWNRVLTTVIADSRSASFGISLSCTGNGLALIYVDSVFVSNQVTPDNIDQFQLDFGDGDSPSETTGRPPSTPTSEPTNPVTSIEPGTTNTNTPPATTTGFTRPEIPSQEVCPDGYKPPGFCGQKSPQPSEPICKYRSQPNADVVAYPLSQYPMQGMDIQKCALTCAYIDGCFAFAVNDNKNYPCNFVLEPLRASGWTSGDPDRVLEWSELECFNCQLCGDSSSSRTTSTVGVTEAPVQSETTVIAEPSTRVPQNTSHWLPDPGTSSGNLEPTPGTRPTSIRPPRPETSIDVGPTFIEDTTTWPETTHTSSEGSVVDTSSDAPEDSTSLSEDATSTTQDPTSTSETTTASETPTETCKYTHGEMCNFDRFNYPKDVLCSWGDKFTSRKFWLETREAYPHQDRVEQCIAICQGHPLCLTAGYSQFENRCYFSELPLLKENFVAEENDWKKQAWLDTRCYTDCEACVPDSVPKGPPDMCAYTLGDECKPVANPPDGTICNYNAYMGGGWVDGNDPNLISVYTEYAQASPRRCAAICRAYPGCKGSGYKDDRCKFSVYKLALTGMPIPLETDKDPSMNSIWDDPACWTCPGCE
ncbi:uncharacterized protein FOBCDRAFT_192144 [Fusarium oxysporum Fo47]|uniref:DUF7908 domain-containing protein n=1 Tax=Fusarium oxysporum Fo47 TaxID=660027 RepID=W9JMR9_FUSOX|nr:uncharacterized protein FOBCDRAFT_192144 [Fusarium oxysporum Fo47]EWZ30950.1 hypothetical protein FOZG_15381 [Fusarium oxysporum Fo47]QKD61691.1 hypothetical protein FOBCDRAFT_192144 [Fusarium oxysporum Fo47]